MSQDGITNATYAGVNGFGVVNDLNGLATAIQDASAAGKRLVVTDLSSEDSTAYFISSESKTARTIRNIKAFFGQGESGRVHDVRVKDALIALATKKSNDRSVSSHDRLFARGIADGADKINANSIAGNSVKTFRDVIAAASSVPSDSTDVESHYYHTLESGDADYEYVSSKQDDDYAYPQTPSGNSSESEYSYARNRDEHTPEPNYSYSYARNRDEHAPSRSTTSNSDDGYSRLSDIEAYPRYVNSDIPRGEYEPEEQPSIRWQLGAAQKISTRGFDDQTAARFIVNNREGESAALEPNAFKLIGPETKPGEINPALRDAANLAGVRTENIHLLSALIKSSDYEELVEKALDDPETYNGHEALANNKGAQQIYVVARILDGFIRYEINSPKTVDPEPRPIEDSDEQFTVPNRIEDPDEQFTVLNPNTRVADEEEYTPLHYKVTDQ